ncbi:PilZ domain-containing protein [Sphingobium ummariense]|uniref:PilZ domain-containing protein n=1 Tax=Sphingobium ummariense RL-3 TaxID=1346791 RepID=T0IZV1_9SPHN|nr:PilZ domain-containing protein [Sphingobium ummariense]EQB30067.1 hypothetical protein M529_21680 [Sphingobium ummariense RL-3]
MSSLFANLSHVVQSRDPSVNRRRAARDLVDMVSHVTIHGRTEGVRIINISPLGVMCRTDADLPVGVLIAIWLPVVRDVGVAVRWAEEGRAGMEFVQPIVPATYEAMLALIPPRRTAW